MSQYPGHLVPDRPGLERLLELMNTPGRWAPLFQIARGRRTIDLSEPGFSPDLPPHRIVLLLAIRLALKDRATEVHFEPWNFEDEAGFRMLYLVNGDLEELVPPPPILTIPLLRDLESAAGLRSPRMRLGEKLRRLASRIDGQGLGPRQGTFHLVVDDDRIDVHASFWPVEEPGGSRVFLKFDPIPEAAAGRVSDRMHRDFTGGMTGKTLPDP